MTIYQHSATGVKIEVLEGTKVPSSFVKVTNKSVPVENKIDVVVKKAKSNKRVQKKKSLNRKATNISVEVES